MTSTVRLVRCPKCRQLLRESADVPLYRCGGCGVVLQAKSRKSTNNNGLADLRRNGDAPINGLDNNAQNGQLDLPVNSDTVISDKMVDNGRSELPENGDASTGRLDNNAHNGQSDLPMGGHTNTDELDKSVENGRSNMPGNGDPPIEGLDKSLGNKGSIDSDLQVDLHDADNHQIGKIDYDSDDKGSISSKESIVSTQETIPPSLVELSSDQKNVAEENISIHCSTEQDLADKNICENGSAEETPTCDGHQDRESSLDESNDKYSETEHNSLSNDNLLSMGGANLQVQILGKSSQTVDTESEEGNTYGNSNSGSPWLDEQIVKEASSEVVAQRPTEVLPRDHVVISDKSSGISRTRERLMSRETIASTEYADPNSEFSDGHQDLDDSPPRRGKHVYDGSVSSLEDIKNHSLDRDMYLPMRRGYSRRLLTRSDRPPLPPRVPTDHRTDQAGYEDLDTLKGYRNFQRTSSSYFDDLSHYREPDKMMLLRMVYELEDQLKRSCQLDDMGSGRASLGATWAEKERPMHRYHDLPEEEDLAESNLSGYGGRYMVENGRPLYYASSQRPSSRETTRSHQLNHSRLHWFPHEWRYSEPLPRLTSRNESLYSIGIGRSAYAPYSSLPPSPQQHMDPEFLPWDNETKSEDQMYRFQKERRYLRDKTDSAKRHYRPKAGGAPLITCYCCSQVLQLPEDFLVLKKRCHCLKCGACSAVLKFSLQNRIHIVPYVPKVSNPPPSEADDFDEAQYGRDFSSASLVNHSSQTERMSYYDDYGVSISQSFSTEGHADDIRTSRDACSTQMNGRKNFGPSDLRDKGKKPLNVSVDAPEIEEIPRRAGSPLHELMGYPSVSQVFRGREPKEMHGNSSSHISP